MRERFIALAVALFGETKAGIQRYFVAVEYCSLCALSQLIYLKMQ